MKKNTFGIGIIVAGLATIGAITGCESHQTRTEGNAPNAAITIETAGREVLVGETVAFIARTRDTYGRDAKVKWSSTAGDLNTDQDGRIARVTFKETGTYSVKATLSIDGQDVQSALAEVRVRPVK